MTYQHTRFKSQTALSLVPWFAERDSAEDRVIPLLQFLPANNLGFPWKTKLGFAASELNSSCSYKGEHCKCDSGWLLRPVAADNSGLMVSTGSSGAGCGGRWLKAVTDGSHRFLLYADSFPALYGRFFSGLIRSLSYFSHFLWLIYLCFEFFFWERSQHPAVSKC